MNKSMINSINARSLVKGVGINDANYPVRISKINGLDANGKTKHEIIWACPFYMKWLGMITRAVSGKYKEAFPTYLSCTIHSEWLYFSNFKAWMETQDWEGKHLDKDLLVYGNKHYGPETCVFVSPTVNYFIREKTNGRGLWPVGVTFDKKAKKYLAGCNTVFPYKKRKTIGRFCTPEEAHAAWLAFKLDQAKLLAEQQTDERVAKALIHRYENYKNEA